MEQLSLFSDLEIKSTISQVPPSESQQLMKKDFAESLMDFAMDLTDETPAFQPDAVKAKSQAFLMGVTMNRMKTIKTLLGRTEKLENILVSQETLKDLHPRYILDIYKAFQESITQQIEYMSNTKELITNNINVFAAQLNNVANNVSANTLVQQNKPEELSKESREKVFGALSQILDLNKILQPTDTPPIDVNPDDTKR